MMVYRKTPACGQGLVGCYGSHKMQAADMALAILLSSRLYEESNQGLS
jgi:hypothetical protein